MKTIQLYDMTRGLNPPATLHGTHWRTIAVEAERALHTFLRLPPEAMVLLTNSATSAIRVVLRHESFDNEILVPARTWESVWCAVSADHYQLSTRKPGGRTLGHECAIVADLGGVAPKHVTLEHFVIHDCAHVCFPDMFRNWSWDNCCAVLSFYPTKPMGAFGGGALIGRKDVTAEWRSTAWPIARDPRCLHVQPSTVQCWGLLERIRTWSDTFWAYPTLLLESVSDILEGRGWVRKIPRGVPTTPHLLSFERTPELAGLCKRAKLETGTHYPHYGAWRGVREYPEWLSVPFWTEEVLCRLRKVL